MGNLMIMITRVLPGEREGEIDPEDFGFEIIRVEPPDEAEAAARVGALYAQVKERTGVEIPKTERYLAEAASVVTSRDG
jgi:hypothetical protein